MFIRIQQQKNVGLVPVNQFLLINANENKDEEGKIA